MTANKQIGEGMGAKRVGWLAMAALAVGMTMSLPALAENVLKDVRYAQAAGGKVDITLEFAEPVGDVQAFTTDTPPRIAVDLPETTNGLAQRREVIGSGAVSAVSAVESGGRTRVVVDLFRPAAYTARSSGNLLVLTVDAGASSAVAGGSDPTKKVMSDIEVANIDFRRGENGSGRVILRFNGDGATADMRNEGSRVVVDVPNASIPESLRRNLDVTDFATPVTSLEPRANAGSTRLVINTNGAYESMAYQTGNEYVVEIAPKRGAAPMIAGAPGRAAGAVDGAADAKSYTGRPVTFNFQDVPVRTVLQLIAEESGLNVVAADTVQGNVTLRLINVPWDQAMDIVLRAKQLDKRREGNVIWVAPQKEIADFEQALADARIAIEDREPLVTEYIPINYGNAQEIADLLTEGAKFSAGGGSSSGAPISRGFLSPRGSVTADTRTNTLLIIDIPRKIDEIRTLLATLDRPVDQVLIEARIVIATEVFARELGAMFGVQDRVGTLPAAAEAGRSTSDSGFLVDLPATTPAGVLNLSILRSDIELDLELSALEEEGRGEVVSNPRVITANQREAIIRQGDEVGYLTIQPAQAAGGVVTAEVEFKEVLLELKVTPTITQDGRVYLNLMVKKDEVSELIANPAGGFVPQIAKREVSTAVLVDNGQTVVVGGVYEFKSREDLRKVPWLGDVPVLGNLFRNKSRQTEKAELLIFVTPRVLQVAHRG